MRANRAAGTQQNDIPQRRDRTIEQIAHWPGRRDPQPRATRVVLHFLARSRAIGIHRNTQRKTRTVRRLVIEKIGLRHVRDSRLREQE